MTLHPEFLMAIAKQEVEDKLPNLIDEDIKLQLLNEIEACLRHNEGFKGADNFIENHNLNKECITRLKRITSLFKTVPYNPTKKEDFSEKEKPRGFNDNCDNRLLCALWKYGDYNWKDVEKFVGHGLTKQQCSQRWNRVLKVKKEPWSMEEDNLLIKLVNSSTKPSWIKISNEIKGRSDVQCRYRWKVLTAKNKDTTENIIKLTNIKPDIFDDIMLSSNDFQFPANSLDIKSINFQNRSAPQHSIPIPILRPACIEISQISVIPEQNCKSESSKCDVVDNNTSLFNKADEASEKSNSLPYFDDFSWDYSIDFGSPLTF